MAGEEDTSTTDGQGEGQNTNSADAGGEFQGNSLLTKPDAKDGDKGGDGQDSTKDGDKDADKNKDGDKGADADKVPDKPEGYALTFAKDVQVDADLLAGFQKAAHELGIPPSKAQKLADMYVAHQGKAGERIAEAQQKAIDSAKTKWEGEIEARPNFTQEREHARTALRQFGSQELYMLMDQTNIGSHPLMWDFLAKIGKELAEPGFHGKQSKAEKSAAEVLYPNQGK